MYGWHHNWWRWIWYMLFLLISNDELSDDDRPPVWFGEFEFDDDEPIEWLLIDLFTNMLCFLKDFIPNYMKFWCRSKIFSTQTFKKKYISINFKVNVQVNLNQQMVWLIIC